MHKQKHKVFVYGTLKHGYSNYQHYLDKKQDVPDSIKGYYMWDFGAFPFITKENNKHATVYGEVYEVDDNELARLDQLEGTPHLYVREKIVTELGQEVFVYVASDEYTSLCHNKLERINDGIW